MSEQTPPAADPTPGSPEYDTMMATRYREMTGRGEQQTDPQEEDNRPVRPEYVPEKFWNAETGETDIEALSKSYRELERGRPASNKADAAKDGLKIPESSETDAAKAAVENAGLDWDTIGNKIAESGSLEDSDMEALEKSGIPRQIVENFLTLHQRDVERRVADAISHVGGEDKMNELLTWAAGNLSKDEIEGYNKMLRSASWKTGFDTLSTLYAKSNPTSAEPRFANTTGSVPTAGGYATRSDMVRDMSDPRYQTDPNFRRMVAQKVQHATYNRS